MILKRKLICKTKPKGGHTGDREKILDSFRGEATREEQLVKFLNLAQKMKEHLNLKEKYQDNADFQNREIAFGKIFD